MSSLVAAVLVLVPLVLAPSVLFYFDVTGKAVVALWGAAAVLPWLAAGRLSGLRSTRQGRCFCLLLGASGLWLVASAPFAARPELSMVGTNWRRFGVPEQLAILILAAAAGEAAARGGARIMLRATACAGIAIALYGILQYFGRDPWLPAAAYRVGEGVWAIVRPPGTLGHAAYFANWLLFAVFAGAALWFTESAGAWRAAGLAAALAGCTAILLSGTRAGIAGIASGAVLLGFWLRPRVSRRGVAIVACMAAALAAFYYSPAGQQLRARTRWYVEDAWGGARIRLWRDSAALTARHPLVGTGPETFSLVFPKFESRDLAAAYPDFYHESPHNLFLDACTAAGLPAAVTLAALLALAFYSTWQFRRKDPALSGCLAAGIAAALVSHQFSVLIVPTALAFYTFLAMAAATGAKPPAVQNFRTAAALAALPAAALLFWGGWLVAADRRQLAVRADLQQGLVIEAIDIANGAAPPFDRLWFSRALTAAARNSTGTAARLAAEPAALSAAVRAARESDNPQNAWYEVAMLRAAKNDAPGTERALRNAIDAAPNWFKPHWTLARLLHMTGRAQEARSEALLAVRLNPRDAEVARTLAAISGPVTPR